MEKDIVNARRPVEGFEFAAWKFFKPSISLPSATSGNHRFVPTRHRNFNSSSGFITGLLLLCGDIISQPGPTITRRTQTRGPSVPSVVYPSVSTTSTKHLWNLAIQRNTLVCGCQAILPRTSK